MLILADFSNWALDPSGLTPHGFCLLWQPGLIATYAIADGLIAISYLTIPVALGIVASRRRDLMFRPVFMLFASFILLCGISHMLDVLTLWVPAYGLEAIVKGATAIVSIVTAFALWKLLPGVLRLPSHEQMRTREHELAQLSKQAAERQNLLDMVNVAAVMLREIDGTILFWSEGCRRLYGWTASQAVGRSSHELLEAVFPVSLADADTTMLRDGSWIGEVRHRRRDGSPVIVTASFTLHDKANGHGQLVVETVADMSALRQVETELRASEAQYAALIETAADGIVTAGEDGLIRHVNPAVLRMFGYERAEEIIGRNLRVLMPANEGARHDGYLAAHHPESVPRVIGVSGRELLALRRNGSEFPIDLSVSSFRAAGSLNFTGIIRDASARKQQEAAFRDNEARLRDLLLTLGLGVFMARDLDGTIRYWSAGCEHLYGWTSDEAIGRSAHELLGTIFPVPLAEVEATLARVGEWDGNLLHRTRGGQELTIIAHKRLRRSENGGHGIVLEALTDITERRRAEMALRDSEARLRLVQQVGGIAYTDQAMTERLMLVSKEFLKLYGLPPDRTEVSMEEWNALLYFEDRGRVLAERQKMLESDGILSTEFRINRSDGAVRWVTMRAGKFSSDNGKSYRIIGAQQDISDIIAAREALADRQQALEQRVAERTAALAKAEARFRGIFDSQFQSITLIACDGATLEMNRTALDAVALTREVIIGQPFWETAWWPVHERDRIRQEVGEAALGKLIRHDAEIIGAHGQRIWIDFSLKPARDPATNAVMWIIAESRDLTEKRNLANQLAQSQKVQALGQLAGGIAHDFNNILQAVSGAATLIEQRPTDHVRISRLATTLIAAAIRGTSITQRLLSFARRGELRAMPIASDDLLINLREVLAHTLGTTITVNLAVQPGLPALLADRPQLETAIINLGTNARDAMPNGGVLTLSADSEQLGAGGHHPAGLAPGDYVRLEVSDNGTGMDDETLARVSEPFFTTKPQGQGTGLGVAMAKGFAEQSGGGLMITSALGIGTKVTMWLRQAKDDFSHSEPDESDPVKRHGIAARVLVVDDDDLVREMVAASLEEAGLSTLVASGGLEALALLESGEIVDAMVSDLSMPGMNGVTTIQKARILRPGLPCFLLTGYMGERAALSSENAFTLVHKPVSGRALVAQIEASLESARH